MQRSPCSFLLACPQTIHAIKRDGTLLKGTDALKQLYSAVDLGWAAQFGDWPIISNVCGACVGPFGVAQHSCRSTAQLLVCA